MILALLGIYRLLLVKIFGMDQQGIVSKHKPFKALPALSDGSYELLIIPTFDER